MNQEPVKFYTTGDEYGFLSNFYKAKIILDDLEWPSTEHYYQAQKSLDHTVREVIRLTPRCGDAARLGRSCEVRPGWEDMKCNVMLRALVAKFEQHPILAKKLLATGDREIIEWTEGTKLADSIWGNARDKDGNPGQNLLGKLLMAVRTWLREQENKKVRLDV